MSLTSKIQKLNWFVCLGETQWLDDRGRVKDYKCYMTQKQAMYLQSKRKMSQASMEDRH